jgi:hypothetical protein
VTRQGTGRPLGWSTPPDAPDPIANASQAFATPPDDGGPDICTRCGREIDPDETVICPGAGSGFQHEVCPGAPDICTRCGWEIELVTQVRRSSGGGHQHGVCPELDKPIPYRLAAVDGALL